MKVSRTSYPYDAWTDAGLLLAAPVEQVRSRDTGSSAL